MNYHYRGQIIDAATALLMAENARLKGRLEATEANWQDARTRIAELEYELEQERIHNRNLNKAYDNLARLRSIENVTN